MALFIGKRVMCKDAWRSNHVVRNSVALSSLFAILLFAWQGSKGFSLWDEGYLWYGAQRVILGEVPIRDFMAYDPGRYYWSAALMALFGETGIFGLRAAAAAFQALGLATALLLIASSAKQKTPYSFVFYTLCLITLATWMFPYQRSYDISMSIFLIGILSFLVSNPVPRRFFLAGVGIGLVAVFGRNHGVYGLVGSFFAIAWLSLKSPIAGRSSGLAKCLVIWTTGVAVGFIPVLLMLLLVPGFAFAFWESVRFLFEYSATNLPLPVPWPWTVNVGALEPLVAYRRIMIGVLFIVILLFGSVGIMWAARQRLIGKAVPPSLLAAIFLALPYAHFAFSRADIEHLGNSIFPVVIACLIALSRNKSALKWPLAITLCASSIFITFEVHPGWRCGPSSDCVNLQISESSVVVEPGVAQDIALLRSLANQYTGDKNTFIVAPFWPGAYSLLEKKSPMWEIYALFPRSAAFQHDEIERIKRAKPGFALILDIPLDGREELRYRNTHSIIQDYIDASFELLPELSNHMYRIYRAKGSTQ